jgi:hypothetical protein
MGPIPLDDGTTSGSLSTHPVAVSDAELVIEPFRASSLPAEPLSSSDTHQMPPNLLFHPSFDKREAPAGVSYGEVVHPSYGLAHIPLEGWKMALSFLGSAVRFFILGTSPRTRSPSQGWLCQSTFIRFVFSANAIQATEG